MSVYATSPPRRLRLSRPVDPLKLLYWAENAHPGRLSRFRQDPIGFWSKRARGCARARRHFVVLRCHTARLWPNTCAISWRAKDP